MRLLGYMIEKVNKIKEPKNGIIRVFGGFQVFLGV